MSVSRIRTSLKNILRKSIKYAYFSVTLLLKYVIIYILRLVVMTWEENH